ncbi:hypothetical protein D9619_012443 [Psilocybe cf. subviscida]|uniref:NACHT domain-containing protein n=1 Tax=Psilocybe cf. subviscida TaxID=2480587 RepID=A0A8H5ASI7_9AGAR|nr:hypothetical protein D9619_012443 [Psilocybe cf. subviscida]
MTCVCGKAEPHGFHAANAHDQQSTYMNTCSPAFWSQSLPSKSSQYLLCVLNRDMALNPVANSKHIDIWATRQATTASPPGYSAARMSSMFKDAQIGNLSGGDFRITNINKDNALKALYKRAAPHAILNAGGRADEVRCHPGTREEVIGRIEKWRDAQDSQTPPILWLSGPAGAGKTAIMQTIAERCNAEKAPQANFFFFRTDTSRNSLSPLVATLVHQITLLYPSLRDPMATVLSTDPLILDALLEDQLRQLILTPLLAIQQSSLSYHPPLLLIDGLDECESEEKHSQRRIIDVFDKVLVRNSRLFRLLVASRDESQIRAAFNGITCQLLPLYLDDQYSPEKDIRSFVNDEFKRVRKTHPLAHTIDTTWPSVRDTEGIVQKSSGQFIYAATVMRFIFNSSASPTLSLEMVQGAEPISTKSPFSYLDAIYTFILSRVENQEALKDVLHSQLFAQEYSDTKRATFTIQVDFMDFLEIYNPKYTRVMAQSCVADITSIARYGEFYAMGIAHSTLDFHHASFSDYLLDRSRSKGYFVDLDTFNFKIQPALWTACRKLKQRHDYSPLKEAALFGLYRLRQLPPGLLNSLTAPDITSARDQCSTDAFDIVHLIKHIHSPACQAAYMNNCGPASWTPSLSSEPSQCPLFFLNPGMESNPVAEPKYSNVQATRRKTTAPPKGYLAAGTAHMFNNSQISNIAGGDFRITNINKDDALKALYKRAAPHAILNAGGRADEVRFHPGTREEVIGFMERWRDAQDSQTPHIFWLSGPAGAGKTSIVQNIAERCNAQGVPQANFFFFRTDASRNSLSPLVATLVHQITLLYPSLRDHMATVLSTDPLILDALLEDQLRQLIVTPLLAIQQSSLSYHPPLLLIDGLDECKPEDKHSQPQMIHAFDRVLAEHPSLFRLLVASRNESQIQAAFNRMSSPLLPLYLDNQYSPEKDIRSFLNAEFERVRKTHPLAHMLDATWPSVRDIDVIVQKSSGQFIYAATVMRFISNSSASPALSLEMVQGAEPISVKSPFSHLDAIYTFILSRVENQEALKDILHVSLLLQRHNTLATEAELVAVLKAYNLKYNEATVPLCSVEMTSIAKYIPQEGLVFYHASFPDYLLDHARSNSYFVDVDAFNFKIQPVLWEATRKLKRHPFNISALELAAMKGLLILQQTPPGFLNPLTAGVISAVGTKLQFSFDIVAYLEHIHSLCISDLDLTTYKRILCQWIRDRPMEYYLHFGPEGEPTGFEWPPCAQRYLAIAYIEDHVKNEPADWINIALRAETDTDARETAVWLTDLLRRIHNEIYANSIQEYSRLVGKWVSWAACSNIPLDGVDDLPKVQWHRAMAHIEQNIATEPHGWIDIALRPQTPFDVRETATWLNTLLHRIYREKYDRSVQDYKRLLKIWISWAAWNDIPLDRVDDLPKARWYLQRSRMEKWAGTHLKLGSRTG